jgi:hypothetical protein
MRIQAMSLPLVALLAGGVAGCGKATQPKPQCKAQQEVYAARYFEPEVTGMCEPLVGEQLFLQYYRTDPVMGVPKLAIEPASIADALSAAEEAKVEATAEPEFSIGSFKDVFPDDHDICEAATLKDAVVSVPEIPAMPPDHPDTIPALSLTYKWSNVKVITKPLSNAIHFGATLERTENDCTVKYKVSAIYPVIHCGNGEKPVLDDMGNPVLGPDGKPEMEPDPESGDPDPDACKPSEVGAAEGSGLSPEYAYECEKTTLMCLPAKVFPSLEK